MNHLYCGIDIAKESAAFCLMDPEGERVGKTALFKNTRKGFEDAERWMRKLSKPFKPYDIKICMEATNTYYLPLAKYFHGREGITVCVANPSNVKSFGGASSARTKTDNFDAFMLARFAKAMCPAAWTPPAPHLEEMRSLIKHIEALIEIRTSEQNRLDSLEFKSESSAEIKSAIFAHIDFIDKQIADLKGKLKKVAENNPETSNDVKFVDSIPGIGLDSAHKLVALIGDVKRYRGVKQLVATSGIAPSKNTSGTSLNGKDSIKKKGSAKMRKALYMTALSAIQCNPSIKAFNEKLIAAGKCKMTALIACMRKLLHQVYGVLKNKKMYDPAFSA